MDRAAELKTELTEANQRRAVLEKNISDAMALLDTTPVGLHGPLVDDEGFPRNDVDLYAVRSARNTVVTGRNDLREVEERLHELLCELHTATADAARRQMEEDDALRAQRRREVEALQRRQQQVSSMRQRQPFLSVEAVADGSPAAVAGVQPGDDVVALGPVDTVAFQHLGLSGLSAEVTAHEGMMMPLWVLRGVERKEAVELPLVPQKWRGDGLIGCQLKPVRVS